MAGILLDTARGFEELLDKSVDTHPIFTPVEEKSAVLISLMRSRSRLTEFLYRNLNDAEDVAAEGGFRDVADWIAWRTNTRQSTAHTELRLAKALAARPHLASTVRIG